MRLILDILRYYRIQDIVEYLYPTGIMAAIIIIYVNVKLSLLVEEIPTCSPFY